MGLSAGDKLYNIQLSFNQALRENLKDSSGNTGTIAVDYDDDDFKEPEPNSNGVARWLKIRWIQLPFDNKAEILCQVSCVTRNDRMGFELNKLVDLFLEAIETNMENSLTIQDFSSDIESPSPTGRYAVIGYLNPSRPVPTTEAGIREYQVTLRLYYGMNL